MRVGWKIMERDRTDVDATEGPEARTTDASREAATNASGAASDREAGSEKSPVEQQVREALKSVTDPELGINIVDLGLVYDVHEIEGDVEVTMTLTSPGCPAGGQIMGDAKNAAEGVDGVGEATVTLVWKPFWTPEKIDPKVRAALGF